MQWSDRTGLTTKESKEGTCFGWCCGMKLRHYLVVYSSKEECIKASLGRHEACLGCRVPKRVNLPGHAGCNTKRVFEEPTWPKN